MEPFQSSQMFDIGHVKDAALMMQLHGLAQENPGLSVITTRERVTDLGRFETGVLQSTT